MCLNLFDFVLFLDKLILLLWKLILFQLLCKTVCGNHDIHVPPKSDKEEYHLTSRLKQLGVKTCRD